jgi:hypothetical protein
VLRISIVEATNERRLVVEGKLIEPWTTELRKASEGARDDLEGRKLVVDLKNLTIVNQEGEDLLAALMKEGIKIRCRGVFEREVLRQLARRTRAQFRTRLDLHQNRNQ